MFKPKKKGILEKLKDMASFEHRKTTSDEIKSALLSFKNNYRKGTKPPLFLKFTKKETSMREKVVQSSKSFAGALNQTWENHGVKIAKAINRDSIKKSKDIGHSAKQLTSKAIQTTAVSYNALMATEIARSADAFLRDSFAGASNIYDKALDAARSESGHFGGDHRLFDGGHTLSAAWERVKDAVPDDTFIQELRGYIGAIKNDVITPNGLPIKTLDKEVFDRFIDETGVPAQWARDIATFTGTEVLGAGIASLSLALNWNDRERAKFSEFVGGTAVSSIAAANPLLGILSLSAAAIAYQGRENKKTLVADMSRGAAPTAAFIATSGLIGGPIAIGLLAGTVVGVCTSRVLHSRDEADIEQFALNRIEKLQLQ